jgi:hypothetical protein
LSAKARKGGLRVSPCAGGDDIFQVWRVIIVRHFADHSAIAATQHGVQSRRAILWRLVIFVIIVRDRSADNRAASPRARANHRAGGADSRADRRSRKAG